MTDPAADPAALRQEIARLREMLDLNSDWIWEVDAAGRYTYVSRQCLALLGYEPDEMLGRTPFAFMPPDEAARIGAAFGAIVAERRPFSNLLNRNLRRDGRIVVLETSGVPLFAPDGTLTGYRGIDRDVTERVAAVERLHYAAQHDFLTGLPNRRYLRQHLAERLAGEGDVCLLLLDLDRFKPVNDSLGHASGDVVLREVARRLETLAGDCGAFAARLGGDEFALVADGLTAQAGADLAAAVRGAVAEPIELAAGPVGIGASVGLAWRGEGTSVEALLAAADRDLYRNKGKA